MTIEEILAEFRKTANSTTDKGSMFERLMKNFLPVYYEGYVEKVMLWREFSREIDLGIDLVAKTFSGEYWAIQCKFYSENETIDKADVDSFISNSGRSFDGKTFSLRIFISTSDNFTPNAKKMFKNQSPPVIQIGLDDLRKAAVDWENISNNTPSKIYRELRDYQQDALAAATDYFQTHRRGKLIMACGTGKTFTALRIAEKLSPNGLILFLVPSLSLMGQTLREWRNFSKLPIRAICVCSDKTVAAKSDDDNQDVNLPLPVTNQPDKISAAIRRVGNFGMTVIFSTYQSLDKVSAANLTFDLTICDEAHRTAGNSSQNAETKLFSLVHDNKNINSRLRIYMTATPKLYSESTKISSAEKNLTVWSMDDAATFGEEFYRLSFPQAIKKGLLSDYQVLIFAVREDEFNLQLRDVIFEQIKKIFGDKVSFSTDDISKIIGTINALSKRVTENSKIWISDDPKPMHKAVAFLPKVVTSKITAEIFSKVWELYRQTLTPEDAAKLIPIESAHVDGSMNSAEREQILSNLQNTPDNLCRIVSNVRCLSEGVDVPSLDAVIFLSPKKSKVEIIQAVGRALRIHHGKKYGYIIIPIIAPREINGEIKDYFAANNEKYKPIYEIVQALKAFDDAMNVEVERLRVGGTPQKITFAKSPEFDAQQLSLPFEVFHNELIAQIAEHASNSGYWWHWAKKVSAIVQRHTNDINYLIADTNSPQAQAFQQFLDELKKIINPAITANEAVDMLAQHLITRPVFEALFQNYSFAQNNPVSKSMQNILLQLDSTGLENDRAQLKEFYDDVKNSCRDMGDAKNRQKIIVNLYDSFFKMALPQTVERLGIVYTPVEVVDFIINSVADILKNDFNLTFSSPNVHVLDPFTGTGTFITRLIQSGLIQPQDLLRKYQRELHANEIVLLAYYIAAINIENSFHDAAESQAYQNFNGICLADTFQSYENDKENYLAGYENPLRENSALIKDQLDQNITVIIGNPPYSVGQKSANDNAQNIHYPKLERRIAQTYAAKTSATNKNSLYDSYIKAFRWASDRIGNSGIIGFVTNAGWLDGAAMDGLRKCFAHEFSSIYVFNLRGNQRTQGETSRKEGGKIFGSGSRAPIAITILVKNPALLRDAAEIRYFDIGDYLSREQKLAKIQAMHSVLNDAFKILTPNDKADWINQRGSLFENFIPLAPDKKCDDDAKSVFTNYSRGIVTARDAWLYNFSKSELKKNITTMIDFYNSERKKLESDKDYIPVSDSTKISWSRGLLQNLEKDVFLSPFMESDIVESLYRPFCKQNFYDYRFLIEMLYLMPLFFPENRYKSFTEKLPRNLLICVPGIGSDKQFSVFITDKICDLGLNDKLQCFPLYWYEDKRNPNILVDLFGKRPTLEHSGISDFILEQARVKYGARVGKEEIFYYVYGFLHLGAYREKFSAELKKSLPRIILVEGVEDFWAISKAGRELAAIHLDYEGQPSAAVEVEIKAEDYRVRKMRLSADKSTLKYNEFITIKKIPARAYEYVVNGRSPLEWIIDRYQVKTDKASGLVNNPNDWALEHGKPRYILDLVLSSITVSLRTLEIVEGLPEIKFE